MWRSTCATRSCSSAGAGAGRSGWAPRRGRLGGRHEEGPLDPLAFPALIEGYAKRWPFVSGMQHMFATHTTKREARAP